VIYLVEKSGNLNPVVRYEVEKISIPRKKWDEILNPMRLKYEDLRRSKTPVPKYLPVIDNFIVDSENRFWVSVNTKDENYRLWMIFNNKGEKIGEVKLHSSIRLEVITEGYAYGVKTDELGINSVVRYRIIEK
jgi:hypothetical protein